MKQKSKVADLSAYKKQKDSDTISYSISDVNTPYGNSGAKQWINDNVKENILAYKYKIESSMGTDKFITAYNPFEFRYVTSLVFQFPALFKKEVLQWFLIVFRETIDAFMEKTDSGPSPENWENLMLATAMGMEMFGYEGILDAMTKKEEARGEKV